MLSYYQQLRLFEDRQPQYKAFALEKPLWVFVGSKVTAVRTESKKQVSDVVDILLFMAELVANRAKTVAHIQKLLSGDTGCWTNSSATRLVRPSPSGAVWSIRSRCV
ncbi:MAG: hypothetical protein IPH64_09670 [Comamonadaceae bacterium]|nr:hypothetical protein [Comamonadaceae bacterium]